MEGTNPTSRCSGVSPAVLQFMQQQRVALGCNVLARHRIYLDTKYWIFCRDAALDRPQRPIHHDIWVTLLALVENDVAICPSSLPILTELSKQNRDDTRDATAHVIDQLSLGVAIQPNDVLTRTELACLFGSTVLESCHFPGLLAWTRPAFVAGEMYPYSEMMDDKTLEELQIGWARFAWARKFSEVVREMGFRTNDKFDTTYEAINSEALKHSHEVTSFPVVYDSELQGTIDLLTPAIRDAIIDLHRGTTGGADPGSAEQQANAARLGRNAIYNMFRLKKLKSGLPSISVGAGIHAALRHRGQRLHKGDLCDHMHAYPALAYCNSFLTERSLCSLLTSAPLCFDRLHACDVLWQEEEVLDHLRKLTDRHSRS